MTATGPSLTESIAKRPELRWRAVSVLLVASVSVERRVGSTLIPRDFFSNRTRGAANVATVFFYGVFFTQFLQVTGQDAGLASGVQQSVQPVGGALGLAVLVTIAVRHTASLAQAGGSIGYATTGGYVLALRIAAAVLAAGAGLVLVALENDTADPPELV